MLYKFINFFFIKIEINRLINKKLMYFINNNLFSIFNSITD